MKSFSSTRLLPEFNLIRIFRDGLKSQLKAQGFESDELLQEGLLEVLQSKTFRLCVVDSIANGYSQVVIDEGVVYIKVKISIESAFLISFSFMIRFPPINGITTSMMLEAASLTYYSCKL